jgi:DegV family protein with EDD domain
MRGNMRKFELSTDSNCDLYANEIKDLDIYVGHLNYTLEENGELTDNVDQFTEYSQYVDFYNKLRKGVVAKTSILSLQAHIDLFTQMAEKGIKNALHISQSKGLSPTIDNANKAIEIVKEKYPDINYIALQSNTTTIGEGALVRIAAKMRDEGKTAEETRDYIESIKNKLQHIVMVDDLMFLKRGGRIGAASAVLGSMLDIKPIIEITMEGKLEVVRKERGSRKALLSIVNEFERHTLNKEHPMVIIVHTDNAERANLLKQMLLEKTGVEAEVRIMGPIIGAHVGPGAIALGFLSNEDRPL